MVSLVKEEKFEQVSEVGLPVPVPKLANKDLDDDGRPARTGTVWTASAHIITAVIGSGVLSLAWTMAQLGWITGISTLLIFSFITLYTSGFLADSYRSPNPVTGKRNHTYMEAVKSNLGGNMYRICGLVQYSNMCGVAVGYTITAAISVVATLKTNCYHKRGHDGECNYSINIYMVGIGILEILLSQIPNLHKMSWLSFVAAVMSFGYSLIGMGLSFAKIIAEKGEGTTLTGVEVGLNLSEADKIWSMLRAVGDMAFACSYAQVLIEIQDTLKSKPSENKVMRKANMIAILTSTVFYLMSGCLGYAALGNRAPGNLLTDFGFYEPFWLIEIANIFVVLHLLGAYQIASQPVLNAMETWARTRWPESKFINNDYSLNIGNKNLNIEVNLLRLTWRTAYVVLVTLIAMAIPFFNDVLALLGAAGYWPMAVYFPVKMHISQNNIHKHSKKWIALQFMNVVCLVVAIAAACGAIQGLASSLQTYKPFKFI